MIKRVAHITIMLALMWGSLAIADGRTGAGTEAVITLVQGTARAFTRTKPEGHVLRKGDTLGKEDEVRAGERSRVEIRFPDGTIMRLSENSRLAMSEVQYDAKTESKNVKVTLGIGKLWANVKKLVTPDSSVEVKTGNAVAGVRGTVYRMNVDDDKSAMVKVYDGSVYVASPPKGETGKTSTRLSAPVPVAGPHEVPPPVHEVTMEEWHVIVKAMQQVSISSQGVASQPQDFDAQTDADDWVKWNQQRDQKARF